jgi:hypothetical protein
MVVLLIVTVPAAALGSPAAQQSGGNFIVSVAGTAVGSIPHQIDLKATQLPSGQLSEVSGFAVSPEDVIQVKRGENLIVSTSPDLMTHQVTVRNIQGIPIDLVQLPSNAWSLQGLLPGIYTLDVNVAMSSSGILGTYETILVILEPDQQLLPPTTIINQITIRQPDGDGGCPGNFTRINGTCQSSSPRKPAPGPVPVTPMPTPTGGCTREDIIEKKYPWCPPSLLDHMPPTPENGMCIGLECRSPPSPTPNPTPTDYCYLPGVGDWWDNPDCREYLENKNSRKPVCTPDGPPCPPCPEGVEAGWCADEDERQDTDDCLRPDGTERYPGCSDPEPVIEEEESADDEDESAGADDNGSSQGGIEEDSQFG